MTIRLYIDEDSMDRDLVHALRARGVPGCGRCDRSR